jgi:hypothetical protein
MYFLKKYRLYAVNKFLSPVLDGSLYMLTLFEICVFVKTFCSKWFFFFVRTKSVRYEEEIMGVLPGHHTSSLPTFSLDAYTFQF